MQAQRRLETLHSGSPAHPSQPPRPTHRLPRCGATACVWRRSASPAGAWHVGRSAALQGGPGWHRNGYSTRRVALRAAPVGVELHGSKLGPLHQVAAASGCGTCGRRAQWCPSRSTNGSTNTTGTHPCWQRLAEQAPQRGLIPLHFRGRLRDARRGRECVRCHARWADGGKELAAAAVAAHPTLRFCQRRSLHRSDSNAAVQARVARRPPSSSQRRGDCALLAACSSRPGAGQSMLLGCCRCPRTRPLGLRQPSSPAAKPSSWI